MSKEWMDVRNAAFRGICHDTDLASRAFACSSNIANNDFVTIDCASEVVTLTTLS